LLYTDKVASIFPFENLDDNRVNDETRMLYDEGLYKPISVFQELNPSHKEFQKFENNYLETISSNDFKKVQSHIQGFNIQENRGLKDYEMYVNKLTNKVADYLKQHNLIEYRNHDEVRVEKTSATVYMSMLADYLACINNELVIPSTDEQEFERFVSS
jgi:hypothetical protein